MYFRRFIGSVFLLAAAHAEPAAHWAYTQPKPVQPAANRHPIDALLDDARQQAKIRPAPLAAPRQWVERAAFTLTGLPPQPELISRLEAQPNDATWKSIIDELLASPAYGERWARHWMDVARYADTRGYNFDQDNRYPFAYSYRDWLVEAYNRDLPYDRFLKLQIAADLLVDRPDHPDLAALGFLTVGPRAGPVETIDDRVDVVTRGFLASTVACARCHDHKTDPIPTEDYYSLYSIFENVTEPNAGPVIAVPSDAAAYAEYQQKAAKLEAEDLAARNELVHHLRQPESLATYLDLAWRAKQENWDHARATSESFKRGRYRAKAVLKWKDQLAKSPEAFANWSNEMAATDDAGKKAASLRLANTILTDSPEWATLRADKTCMLNYDADRISEIFDVEDAKQRAARASAMSRLEADHPGSPSRAMSLSDRQPYSKAVVFKRGNPASRGPEFERHWLSFLGGGPFKENPSPRLSLAEKIADPTNPLTARVIVNRVWAWNFGAPLAEPGDFGPQQPAPPLLPLLDWLANWFTTHGSSIKDLNQLLLTSEAFRLSSIGPEENRHIDEANSRFWKWNRRRLDFESMRDRLLASSGALDTRVLGGRSVKLDETSSDSRRSLYAFIDRYALPGTFVTFDLPHPDHHSPGRLETTVPQQALFFLNSPLVLRQAQALAEKPEFKALPHDEAKLQWIFQRLFRRPPTDAQQTLILKWLSSQNPADFQPKLSGRWMIRHALDTPEPLSDLREFPLFADSVWKTGPDLAKAPIPWLHAGAGGGHAGAGRALVFRWTSSADGQIRFSSYLKRTQQGGATLAWRITSPSGSTLREGKLAPEATINTSSDWVNVTAGSTMDFLLRAPEGDSCGGVKWTFKIHGREAPGKPEEVLGDFTRDFDSLRSPASVSSSANPWADIIQMLWASNDFNFID